MRHRFFLFFLLVTLLALLPMAFARMLGYPAGPEAGAPAHLQGAPASGKELPPESAQRQRREWRA